MPITPSVKDDLLLELSTARIKNHFSSIGSMLKMNLVPPDLPNSVALLTLLSAPPQISTWLRSRSVGLTQVTSTALYKFLVCRFVGIPGGVSLPPTVEVSCSQGPEKPAKFTALTR